MSSYNDARIDLLADLCQRALEMLRQLDSEECREDMCPVCGAVTAGHFNDCQLFLLIKDLDRGGRVMANDYDDDGIARGLPYDDGTNGPAPNITIGASIDDYVTSVPHTKWRVHKPHITRAILGGEPECWMNLSAPMPKLWRRVLWRILGVRFEVIADG